MGQGLIRSFDQQDRLAELAARVASYESRPKVTAPASYERLRRVGTPSPFGDFYAITTSATFETLFTVTGPRIVAPALFASLRYTNSGADGEVQVVVTAPDGTSTSSAFSAVGADYAALGWLHGLLVWGDDPVRVDVQARRTAGAGAFYVQMLATGWYDTKWATVAGQWFPAVWWAP